MQPLTITSFTLTNALGRGVAATLDALYQGKSGLSNDLLTDNTSLNTWVGQVMGLDKVLLPKAQENYTCRNNNLAYLALLQDGFEDKVRFAIDKYGADRIGLFIGTSTSGVRETEEYFAARSKSKAPHELGLDYFSTQNTFSAGKFIREYLGLKGPAQVISTACSSSAKVFTAASRHIESGFCDAAIVGGVDTLCEMTLFGFNSLQLVSSRPCKPFDRRRDGISIGEAAGFALLEKSPGGGHPCLLGYGESSDAYHISSPHPEGLGAAKAMQAALKRASLDAKEIDYLNLHGTATPANDISEANAVYHVLGDTTPCSSSKGWTGHTLGAAGIIEAVICLIALANEFTPGTLNLELPDERLKVHCLLQNQERPLQYVMSNSFGFGGSNCSLIFSKNA